MAGGREGQRRTPAGAKRRAELMHTAVLLAAEHGFGRTRVSDVVGRVGVGQGVFYWYFESKDALFREILEDTTKRMRLFQGAFIAGEADPIRRIAKGIVASFDFIVRNAHVLAVLDHEGVRVRRTRRAGGGNAVLDTARHLSEAIELGLVRSTDPTYLARAISGVVDHLSRAYFVTSGADIDRFIQEAIDFCLGGLLGSQTLEVSELRAEFELTPNLEELRDKVGAAGNGGTTRSRNS